MWQILEFGEGSSWVYECFVLSAFLNVWILYTVLISFLIAEKKKLVSIFVKILIWTDLRLFPSHILLEKSWGKTGHTAIKVHFGKKNGVMSLGGIGPDNSPFLSLRPGTAAFCVPPLTNRKPFAAHRLCGDRPQARQGPSAPVISPLTCFPFLNMFGGQTPSVSFHSSLLSCLVLKGKKKKDWSFNPQAIWFCNLWLEEEQ